MEVNEKVLSTLKFEDRIEYRLRGNHDFNFMMFGYIIFFLGFIIGLILQLMILIQPEDSFYLNIGSHVIVLFSFFIFIFSIIGNHHSMKELDNKYFKVEKK